MDEGADTFILKYSAPLMKTPFSDFLLHVRNLQCNKDCAGYELLYIDCMEAYGYHRGKEKCRLILKDMYECVYRIKRLRRVYNMQQERHRQYKNGERKEEFAEAPPLDLF